MDLRTLPLKERVELLVKALDGAKQTNEALSNCENADELVTILLETSRQSGLGLTKDDLIKTAPIRDWIWYKNGGALLTLGDGVPRYQQDKKSDDRLYLGAGLVIAMLFIVGILTGF